MGLGRNMRSNRKKQHFARKMETTGKILQEKLWGWLPWTAGPPRVFCWRRAGGRLGSAFIIHHRF